MWSARACASSCDVFSFIRHLSQSVCRWRQTDAAQSLDLCAARIRRQRQCHFHLFDLVFCAVFAARSPRTWEHGRRADRLQPLTGSPRVLLITTQGRPPGLLCRATGVSHPCSIVVAKKPAPAFFRAKWIARCRPQHHRPPWKAAVLRSARHGVFPGVARMDGNVPAVLVYGCQATDELQNFRRSSYSQRERTKYNAH